MRVRIASGAIPREAAARRLQQVAEPSLLLRRRLVNGARALQEIALDLHHAQPLVDVGERDDVDAQPKRSSSCGRSSPSSDSWCRPG